MKLLTIDNVDLAVFKDRPNRFLVELADGRFAHLHDPGRLRELLIPGRELIVKTVDNSRRKTSLDVLAVKLNYWVFIHSGYHSKLAEPIIRQLFGPIAAREVKVGKSRLDFLLEDGRPLEVKGCTLLNGKVALFPDAPTERGTRHVLELADRGGALLFLVFHPSANEIRPNCDTDPKFCAALMDAYHSGVEMKAAVIRSMHHNDRLTLFFTKEIPVLPYKGKRI